VWVAHQRIATREAAGGAVLGRRGDNRESLGNGCDGQAYPGAERVTKRPAPRQAAADQRRSRAERDRHGNPRQLAQPRMHASWPAFAAAASIGAATDFGGLAD